MYRLDHENLRQLADDLAQVAAQRDSSLTTRPWNRFEPDETEWWLVPGTEWPAYKYGKIFLHWTERKRQRARAALHVEKGLGRQAGPAYDAPRGRRLIMDEQWVWHLLVETLADGRFEARLAELWRRSPGRVELTVEAGYVADPDSFDPYAYEFGRDRYTFALTDDSGALTLENAAAEAGLLQHLDSVHSLEDLAEVILTLTEEAWIWVDFMAGVPLQLAVESVGPGNLTLVSELWSDLEQFAPWLRTADAPPAGSRP